ncbi:MAG: hypothetical protein K6E62_00065 [Lachnospiraceae bacterium]|nr:hypothetical protein [Lachnospiraceae bacterium]
MELDKDDLQRGLKYIVGTWQVDFLVNAFSNDLAHIPATEWKSEDGTDFTAINFEFFEDHTMVMKDTSKGKEVQGTWEQTGWSDFHYTLNDFIDIPDSTFKQNAEKLSMQDGNLVFSIGFIAVSMKKIAEGTITKEPDIGDIEMTDAEHEMLEITGRYRTVRAFGFVDGKMDLFTKEEVKAENDKKLAAGEIDEHEAQQAMMAFETVAEIGDDHKISYWTKVPEGTSEETIKEAIEAGEIEEYRDGMFCSKKQPWKYVKGKYYYDTGEHVELFGEVQSPWAEITYDEDGLLILMGGMCRMKKEE